MIEEPRQSGLIPLTVEMPEPLGAGINFSDPNSPLAPFYLRPVHLIALSVIGFIYFISTYFPLWHTDVWGHMRYGQWMVENRAIPQGEPFCPWWDGRVPFTQYYTLTQLIMYGCYVAGERLAGGDELRQMAGGVEFLRLLHALLITARFTILLAVFVRVSRSWPVAIIGIVTVSLLDLSNLAVFRPQTFAEVGFAMLLWPLSRPVLSRRAMVLIPALLAVWANGHGSYVVGFALLGAVFLGRIIAITMSSGPWVWPWRDPQAVRLAATGLLSFVAVGLLNPYGFELFTRTVAMSNHPTLLAAVGEWKPLAFVCEKGWHWVFMISLGVLGLTQLMCRRPLAPHHLVVLLMFGVGVALQNRFVIWWAMVLPWALVSLWAELAERWPARLTPSPSTPSFRKTGIGLALLFLFFMWSGPSRWLLQGAPCPIQDAVSSGTPWELAREVTQPGVGESDWAHEIHDILRKNYPGGAYTGTIMATPMQGDYLMWALAPKVPVTYAHMHLFHPDYWSELGIVGRGEPGWEDVLEKYQVNLLVVEADFAPRLREQLMKVPNQWKIVLDESGDAASKREILTRQLIAIRITPLLLPPRSL